MAIWDREVSDERVYFNIEGALIQKQDSSLTIKVLGVPILKRRIVFNADVSEKKQSLGFNNK